MNWGLIGTIAFWVFVGLGLVVIFGEGIVAMLSRDSVMEGKDDIQPLKLEEPTSPVLVSEAEFRVPAFVPGVEDHEYTEPLRKWQPEHSGRTYVSRSHNGTDLLA